MSGYELGDRVAFTWHLTRRQKRRDSSRLPGREWVTERWPGEPTPAARRGLVIGRRTLSDGDVDYGYDEPTVYYPRRHFTAWLVAFDLNRSPVLVLPEHVTLLEPRAPYVAPVDAGQGVLS